MSLILSKTTIPVTHPVTIMDAGGDYKTIQLANERPLGLYVDKTELVTLMTLGAFPEALCIGYLRNQGLIDSLADLQAVQVDWSVDAAAIQTTAGIAQHPIGKKRVTTGCGQGSMHEHLYAEAEKQRLSAPDITVSALKNLLLSLREYNQVYREAGSVHGCALCAPDGEIISFVEDVGRHNAVDTIAGLIWLEDLPTQNGIFYSTGRLTTEMVLKAAQLGIPTLVSRSGTTFNAVELAQTLGITLIGRLRANHFLAYHQGEKIVFD